MSTSSKSVKARKDSCNSSINHLVVRYAIYTNVRAPWHRHEPVAHHLVRQLARRTICAMVHQVCHGAPSVPWWNNVTTAG